MTSRKIKCNQSFIKYQNNTQYNKEFFNLFKNELLLSMINVITLYQSIIPSFRRRSEMFIVLF